MLTRRSLGRYDATVAWSGAPTDQARTLGLAATGLVGFYALLMLVGRTLHWSIATGEGWGGWPRIPAWSALLIAILAAGCAAALLGYDRVALPCFAVAAVAALFGAATAVSDFSATSLTAQQDFGVTATLSVGGILSVTRSWTVLRSFALTAGLVVGGMGLADFAYQLAAPQILHGRAAESLGMAVGCLLLALAIGAIRPGEPPIAWAFRTPVLILVALAVVIILLSPLARELMVQLLARAGIPFDLGFAVGTVVLVLALSALMTGGATAVAIWDLWTEVVSAVADGIVLAERDGKIVDVSDQILSMLGYQRSEVVGQPIGLLIPDRQQPGRGNLVADFARDPRPRPMTGQVLAARRADGSELSVQVSLTPVRGLSGPVVAVVIRDASAEVAAQHQRTQTMQRLASVVADAPYGHALMGFEGRFTEVNDALCRLLGRTRGALIGSRPLMTGYPEDAEAMTRAIKQVVSGEHVVATWSSRLRHQDGSVIWVDVRASALRDGKGDIASLSTQIVDVTAQVELRRQRQLFAAVIEQSPIGYSMQDLHGRFIEANAAFCSMLGYPREDLIGQTARLISHPDDADFISHAPATLLSGDSPVVSWRARYRRREGSHFWGEVHMAAIRGDAGDVEAFGGLIQDVSTEVQERERRTVAEGVWAEATERAPIGQAVLAPDGTFLQANSAFCAITGLSVDELVGQEIGEITLPSDREREAEALRELLAGESAVSVLEKRYVRADGHTVWVRQHAGVIRGADDRPVRLVVQAMDISSEREAKIQAAEAEADLRYRSSHDILTGLRNRAEVMEALTSALEEAEGTDRRVGVLFIDVDDFKQVNDGISHAAGDQVLVGIAHRLRGSLRERDRLGRIGGDEFVAVIPDLESAHDAAAVAAKLRDQVAASEFMAERQPIRVTISVGVAMSRPHLSAQQMLSEADAALYRAKWNGRNRWEVADEAMRAEAARRLGLARAIRQALEQDEFHAWFQPVVSMPSGELAGYEALARWVPAGGAAVPADDFIRVAEENGLILELGKRVIEESIGYLATLRPPLTIAVNASPSQISAPGFGRGIKEMLQYTRADPSRLILEVTEQVLMNLGPSARKDIDELAAMGLGIHVDDFGTGYSSLAHLRDYPVTGIKLDMSFTSRLTEDLDSPAARIVGGLAGLAERLELTRVAEGVETREQETSLMKLGWDHGQGWLYGAAQPPSHPPIVQIRHVGSGTPVIVQQPDGEWRMRRKGDQTG